MRLVLPIVVIVTQLVCGIWCHEARNMAEETNPKANGRQKKKKSSCPDKRAGYGEPPYSKRPLPYEIWAPDQSNSGNPTKYSGVGQRGGFIWIWHSDEVEKQLLNDDGWYEAKTLPCTPHATVGPCDVLEVFPQSLQQVNDQGQFTGKTLGELNGFGRVHGMLRDSCSKYLAPSFFAPGGAYIGIIDTETKEAIALFRTTAVELEGGGGGSNPVRSVHMSYFTEDGSAILIANLNAKLLERIDLERDQRGNIIHAKFNRSASLSLGKGTQIAESATAFVGNNAFGRPLIGQVTGTYDEADLSDYTPFGKCKENGCGDGTKDGSFGGRPNNVVICPVTSDNDHSYITLGGGGLLVADLKATPMRIVGEYGNQVIHGAGCAGAQSGNQIFIDAGVSASGAGSDQSMFAVWSLDDSQFSDTVQMENDPPAQLVFKDPDSTASGGNIGGKPPNDSGQILGVTTRRDAHGAVVTVDGKYLHVSDRILGLIEVFDVDTYDRTTYNLYSVDGQGSDSTGSACLAATVIDGVGDPAPDLLDITPDNKYVVVALRGPVPVSVGHAAQGSCVGVGLVELLDGGSSGKLVSVLRTTNEVDQSPPYPADAINGLEYTGPERSDIHHAVVVDKF